MIPSAPPAHGGSSLPWVRLRSAGSGPNLFKRMLAEADPKIRSGDIAAVYDKTGAPYGIAVYNDRSLIALRLISRESAAAFNIADFFKRQITRAVSLRRDVLKLDSAADAYRLVHDHGDGLPGLVADRYGGYIALEFYSRGMYMLADKIEDAFREHFPTAKFVRRASKYTETMEGFSIKRDSGALHKTRITENGVVFEVNLTGGYKTGFFCDQRDNRLAASRFAKGKNVLDVCSYTGGFGIFAKKTGGAEDVICVELDAEASAMSQKNASLNHVKVESVCVDAFPYMRQAAQNSKRFGLVILDPHKLIASREGWEEGAQKYRDLNRLALALVEEGGVFVTSSCSGLVSASDLQQFLRTATGAAGRRVQVFAKTGAGPDHPYASDYPEGEYLKTLWCRVF
ncbi:MAG: class I SAM-dependent rRNA methyltransferase [Elusimicrobiales bacterium]